MKILIDMNLSPEWLPLLSSHGFDAVHWSRIGAPNSPDAEIMQWARTNGHVVFTHDLDFGVLLAHSHDGKPSVVQVRTQDVTPSHLGPVILSVLRAHETILSLGALITVDEARARVRILPL